MIQQSDCDGTEQSPPPETGDITFHVVGSRPGFFSSWCWCFVSRWYRLIMRLWSSTISSRFKTTLELPVGFQTWTYISNTVTMIRKEIGRDSLSWRFQPLHLKAKSSVSFSFDTFIKTWLFSSNTFVIRSIQFVCSSSKSIKQLCG